MANILEQIGSIDKKESMLFKCYDGIKMYAKIIAHKLCFIEAIAEHNFIKLKS